MRVSRRITLAAAGLLAFGLGVRADDRPFVFTSIDVPNATSTGAFGINARGEVVGPFRDLANKAHGYVWTGEAFHTIDFAGAIATDARGISSEGEIVGSYRNPGEPPVNFHGYRLTRGGDYVRVDFPGHINTIPQRIGPGGTIVGCYHDTDTMGTMHGIVILGEDFSAFDMPTSMHNGRTPGGGTIVGLYTDMGTTPPKGRAYLLEDDTFIPFDFPGAKYTAGWDINPSRHAVGTYQDASGGVHGFVVDRHWNFTSIDYPGATATRAFGINSRGDVVGQYVDASNRNHGFLASRSQGGQGGDDDDQDE